MGFRGRVGWQTAVAGCKKGGGRRWETLNTASQLEVSIKFQCLRELVSSAAQPLLAPRANQREEKGLFASGGDASSACQD